MRASGEREREAYVRVLRRVLRRVWDVRGDEDVGVDSEEDERVDGDGKGKGDLGAVVVVNVADVVIVGTERVRLGRVVLIILGGFCCLRRSERVGGCVVCGDCWWWI